MSALSASVSAAIETLQTALNYGTLGRYDIEQRVGGNPSTNVGTDYRERVTRPASHGSPRSASARACCRRTPAPCRPMASGSPPKPDARRAADRLGQPDRAAGDPTLTMHTQSRPAGDRAERGASSPGGSRATRTRHGSQQLFIQPPAYATGAPYGAGHCNFSTTQYVGVVDAIDGWVRTGSRPTATELTQLFAAQPGALDLDYRPAAWPAR